MSLIEPFENLISLTSQRFYQNLGPIRICGIQHILPSQELLFGSILQSGITDMNPVIIGKVYSTVIDALPSKNYNAYEPQKLVYNRGEFEGKFKQWLRRAFELHKFALLKDYNRPTLVLDDGGFIGEILSKFLLEHNCPVVIIEQTTSGLRYAKNYECPYISVASSVLKREVESALVADSIVRALLARSILPTSYENWAIGGFGAIGAALCRTLQAQKVKKILVYDRDPELKLVASKLGFEVVEDKKNLIEQADILLGCTGEDFSKGISSYTINRGIRELICVSCGSSDYEFRNWIIDNGKAEFFRRFGENRGNCFCDISGNFSTGKYIVLNGGFPINFDRSINSDPREDFLLTRMLMFIGVIQALDVIKNGWVRNNQENLLHRSLELAVHKSWFEAFPNRLDNDIKMRSKQLLEKS